MKEKFGLFILILATAYISLSNLINGKYMIALGAMILSIILCVLLFILNKSSIPDIGIILISDHRSWLNSEESKHINEHYLYNKKRLYVSKVNEFINSNGVILDNDYNCIIVDNTIEVTLKEKIQSIINNKRGM